MLELFCQPWKDWFGTNVGNYFSPQNCNFCSFLIVRQFGSVKRASSCSKMIARDASEMLPSGHSAKFAAGGTKLDPSR
jgi:hypothetical protein